MKSDDIFAVLLDWNFWTENKLPYTGTERPLYTERLGRLAGTNQVVTIVGARRSGKSTIMRQYLKKLIESGVDRNGILFVNFEDPRFSSELSLKLMTDIYETYVKKMAPKTPPCLFLDEVQNVAGWEKFVNSLHERNAAAGIVVSGSSSRLLSREFGSVLTGRHVNLEVFPLGFDELLGFRGISVASGMELALNRLKVESALSEMMEWGAMPKVVLSEAGERKDVLLGYFDDIISRDVVSRHKIRNEEKLRAMAKFYMTNVSSPITFNSMSKFLGMPVNTVERFSDYLSQAYLFFFVKKFAYSLKEQEKNPRKVYCIDMGLRNALSLRLGEDFGKIAENIVFLELRRRGKECYYWKSDRGEKEVDFVVKEGQNVNQLIQVCWNIDKPDTKKREMTALILSMNEFNAGEGTIITETVEEEEKIDGKIVKFVPLGKWLLSESSRVFG